MIWRYNCFDQSRARHLLGWLTWQRMDTQHNCLLNTSAKHAACTSDVEAQSPAYIVLYSTIGVPLQHWHEAF